MKKNVSLGKILAEATKKELVKQIKETRRQKKASPEAKAKRAAVKELKKSDRERSKKTPAIRFQQDEKVLTDNKVKDNLRNDRRKSEKALARKTLRPRAARRALDKAVRKVQRIIQPKE